jgi:hypothetical protein
MARRSSRRARGSRGAASSRSFPHGVPTVGAEGLRHAHPPRDPPAPQKSRAIAPRRNGFGADLNDARPLNLKPGYLLAGPHMEILVNTIQYAQLAMQLRAATREGMA